MKRPKRPEKVERPELAQGLLGPVRIKLKGPLNDLTLALARAGFRPLPNGWGKWVRTQEATIESTTPAVRPPWTIRTGWFMARVVRIFPLLFLGFVGGLIVGLFIWK